MTLSLSYSPMYSPQQSLAAMSVALRVLTAINAKRNPDLSDVKELEAYLGPKPDNVSLDEWTCDVIQTAVKKKDWGSARDTDRADLNFTEVKLDQDSHDRRGKPCDSVPCSSASAWRPLGPPSAS